MLLQALEAILIDFDEDAPQLPTLVCHPDAAGRFKEVVEMAMTTEPYKTQYQEIITKKKREFNEREACRKLVD